MNADKIIIAAAALVAVAAFACKDLILNEVHLFTQIERLGDEVGKDFDPVQYYPLTLQERASVAEELLARINELEDKLSGTIVTKYLVDFQPQINALQENLTQIDNELSEGEDYLSFFTHRKNGIIASPDFTKVELLELASLIDELQPNATDTSLYMLSVEEGSPVLDIPPLFPSDDFSSYQTYADRISDEAFSGERVFLRISTPDPEEDVVFESGEALLIPRKT